MTPFFQQLKTDALALGLADLSVTPAGEALTYPRFQKWLEEEKQAEMAFLQRNALAHSHPHSVLASVRTLLIAVISESRIVEEYPPIEPSAPHSVPAGEITPYAACRDYHLVLKEKLAPIQEKLTRQFPRERSRICVDTAPLLEKEWASRARLGGIGLNTLLIHPQIGPSLFLGFLLTTVPPEAFLPPDEAVLSPSLPETNPCVNCRKCLDACPSGALCGDHTLDARRCLCYWTIESRDKRLPLEVQRQLGNRIFGCDRCRRVCPHQIEPLPPYRLALSDLATMTEEEFQRRFHQTPLERLGLERLRRNAARGIASPPPPRVE